LLAFVALSASAQTIEVCRPGVFCVPRALAEDYVQLVLHTVPTYQEAVARFQEAARQDSILAAERTLQIRDLKAQVATVRAVAATERTRADEFASLYQLADRAYRKERLHRRLTMGGGALIVLGIVLLK